MSTKVVTGKVRFSYAHLFQPWAGQEGQEPKYSVCLLIPKKDKKTLAKIAEAIDEAAQDGISSKWGGKKPKNLHFPLRDGDEEREGAEYEGMMFLNASSKQRPCVVDKDLNEILDPEEVYSGCWGRVSINFFAYDAAGNRGIGAGLNNVQKLSDGERLGGGRTSAEDDFGDGFEDDEEDF